MKISNIKIRNFRGVKYANLDVTESQVLLGDNNTGKTAVLEAIDLALGPDRLNRFPVVDEHDFHLGRYLTGDGTVPIGQQFIDDEFGNLDKLFSDENDTTICLLYTSPSPRDRQKSRMPSSA